MEGEDKQIGKNDYYSDANQAPEDNVFFEENNTQEYYKRLRHKEKIHSILILVVGGGSLLLAVVAFVFNLQNPFLAISVKAQKDQAIENARIQKELAIMQTLDTDKDGLTDYEELNQYATSPYLEDSDSDGISDKNEIVQGSDPNCPQGQSCFYVGEEGTTTDYVAPSLKGNISSEMPSMNVIYIRELMKQSGLSADEVNSLSDQEIISEFSAYLQENPDMANDLASQGYDFSGLDTLIKKTSTSTPTVANNTSTTTLKSGTSTSSTIDLKSLNISSVEDLKKLSGAQIRQLMVSAGGSAELLASVKDDQLKEMFIKQIEAKINTQK